VPKIFLVLVFTIFSFASSVVGEIILAEEAKEMLDDHVKQSALLKVPLPQDNRIIKDYERYKNYRTNILANNYHFTDNMWKQESHKGKTLTKDLCMDIIADFKVPTTPKPEADNFINCLTDLMNNAVVNFDDGIKTYRKLLLRIANSQDDKWTYKDSGSKDNNPRDYQLWGVLSPLTIFYAVNIDALNYSDKENAIIQQYLKKKAMIERFDRDGDGRIKCNITDPMNFWRQKHSANNCGSMRLRAAPAELALAIIMQDEELWAKGLWDLDYTLSMIEEEGYFVPLSAKGCKALGYTWDTSKLFSLNLEMLQLAGFNLLDYTTRHGKTVAEAYEILFKQYEDITISNHIAKKGFGAASCGTKPYKTHNEFFALEFGVKAKEVDEIIQDNKVRGNRARIVVPTDENYINWSIRFVSEKHPEWIEDKRSLEEIKVHPSLSQYYHVQPFEIYNANILSENSNIWLEKNKVAKIEAKKEKENCADSELNGEYKATWIFHNINGGYDPETQGSEKLVIENCIGKFEGVKNFQPSPELRENLEVTLKSDGHVEVIGDLDLFEPGRSYYTLLEGNINAGEISGYWEEGDLITIKLIGAKELQAQAEEKLKEIPIFDFTDQIYSLNLSEFTFNEIKSYELETNKKFLHPWQLHKGFPYGDLVNKKQNKTFKFRTLVFKQTGTMQRLVINISDDADSEIEPFKSHRTSLQEKCGSELLDEWGWFSFITETRDIEQAKQQQCHYDYFKNSNDMEAWELYQAVLSGAKSILKYIEKNAPL